MSHPVLSLTARNNGRPAHRYIQPEASFVPQATVPRKLGSETLMICPLADAEASDAEKSHNFHVNAQAIDCASTIHAKTKFIFFGESIGQGADCAAQCAMLQNTFDDKLFDPANMTLVSYRDEAGDAIAGCLIPAGDPDAGTLKPVQDGVAANCRPTGIRYMTVSMVLLFDNNKRQMFTQTFELPM